MSRLSERLQRVEALLARIADGLDMARSPAVLHRLLTFHEVCDLLQVGRSTAERWRARKDGSWPPAVEVGGQLRWSLQSVLRWVEEREERPRRR